MELKAKKLADKRVFFGRTIFDRALNAVFFNWSGSGFEITFRGTGVDAELIGLADYYPTEGTNLPWLAVVTDNADQPSKLIEVPEGAGTFTLYESREIGLHTIRVIKRSENTKGRVGVRKIMIDGELVEPFPRENRRRLEFIGDSITCGFGNETDSTGSFSTALENGLETYAAITAKLLDVDYHSVCISGIPLCWSYNENFRIVLPDLPDFQPPKLAMEDYYAYTDRFHQSKSGLTDGFEEWDFERFKPDAIIINLGTNDAFRVKVSGNDPLEEKHFERRYKEFLYMLRRLNGDKPVIGCTLGSMDYYLYDNILRAVAEYQAETGDKRIFCYKFGGIFLWEEGIGALDHPSVKTHRRMGRELAEVLQKWL